MVVGDPTQKEAVPVYTLEELSERIQARIDSIDYGTTVDSLARVLSPETALGGAKPNASVMVENQYWIAKFPERGDVYSSACHEDFTMKLGRIVGINTAKSTCQPLPDGRCVYLTQRFDRHVNNHVLTRTGFASAMTVMGQVEASQHYSFLDFAKKIKDWVPSEYYQPTLEQLWRRIAFNALIGNTDDHARNHALIKTDGAWELSPAYDILPTKHKLDQCALSMSICRVDKHLTAIASPQKLNSIGARLRA